MAFVMMLVVGLIVGVLAKLIMPGRDASGIIATIALGLAGSFSAGLVGRELGWYGPGHRAGILASIVGAVVLLALFRAFIAARSPRAT